MLGLSDFVGGSADIPNVQSSTGTFTLAPTAAVSTTLRSRDADGHHPTMPAFTLRSTAPYPSAAPPVVVVPTAAMGSRLTGGPPSGPPGGDGPGGDGGGPLNGGLDPPPIRPSGRVRVSDALERSRPIFDDSVCLASFRIAMTAVAIRCTFVLSILSGRLATRPAQAIPGPEPREGTDPPAMQRRRSASLSALSPNQSPLS